MIAACTRIMYAMGFAPGFRICTTRGRWPSSGHSYVKPYMYGFLTIIVPRSFLPAVHITVLY